MKQYSLGVSPYFIGVVPVEGVITFCRGCRVTEPSIIICENLDKEMIQDLYEGKYKAAIFINETAFSHNANILRVISSNNSATTTYILGARLIGNELVEGKRCYISPLTREIKIGKSIYKFDEHSLYHYDDIAILTRKPSMVCFRPYYYYHNQLAKLVAEGFRLLGQRVYQKKIITIIDKVGRVWVDGIGFSKQISNWALINKDMYINEISKYGRILQKMLTRADEQDANHVPFGSLPHDKKLLIEHYYYSPIICFPLVYFINNLEIATQYNKTIVNDVLNSIAAFSPQACKEKELASLVDSGCEIAAILKEDGALRNNTLRPVNLTIGDVELKLWSPESNLLLLAGVFAELRRGVVTRLRNASPWLAQITRHRKE